MPTNFQYSNTPGPAALFAERASKKAREILSKIKKSKTPEPKKVHLPEVDFENVKIERRNDYIYYIGSVTKELLVIGFINFEGNGEEILIHKSTSDTSKKHKIIMFKTVIDYKTMKSDYFTKSTLQTLVRTRIS